MPRRYSENTMCQEMIDQPLEKAGWYLYDHTKVKVKFAASGHAVEPSNGVFEYRFQCENLKFTNDLIVSN